MKSNVINTKDWDISKCMSAIRFQDYTIDDFIRHNDFKTESVCERVTRCKVKKCNIKKFLKENITEITKRIHKDLLGWIDRKVTYEENLLKRIP